MRGLSHTQREKGVYGSDLHNHRWRVGRKVGRTLYALSTWDAIPRDSDPLIGMMDTPELAAEAVRAHNLDHDIRASR